MKVTAIAHPIQGLIKYHGLRDVKKRIPFHDSISVCVDGLNTTTTVATLESSKRNSVMINGKKVAGTDLKRVNLVLDKLRDIAGFRGSFKVVSENSIVSGKGLGFSASGFAALGTAACRAVDLDLDRVTLSELVRLGAGSATRSLAGGFALWYADRGGRSYAEQIAGPEDVDLGMVIVPIPSAIKTDEAHTEVLTSPLFEARLKHVTKMVKSMEKAIGAGDVAAIGKLAEEDSLNLHASTMTGGARMVLWEPETVRVIRDVQKMRSEGIPAWFSMDTGPSVFVNTLLDQVDGVEDRLLESGHSNAVVSKVGGEPVLVETHLF
jgi:phosphomevalonate decarboxylase